MDIFHAYETPGAFTGVLLLAFLVGVAAHSVYPHTIGTSVGWVVVWLSGAVMALVPAPKRLRLVFAVCLVFLFGVWRFDVAPTPKLRWIDGVPSIVRTPLATEPVKTFAIWRVFLTERLSQAMPHDEATLVASMMYGDDSLSKTQKRLFQLADLMHIVAVSGSNVTFFLACIVCVFRAVHLRRRVVFVLASCALLFFVCFVGLSVSVLRAGFVGELVLIAGECGFLVRRARLLLCAAVLILLINPWQLGYDPGFAVTFLALWGLLEWSPIVERALRWIPKRFGLRSLFAATLSATIMVVPYSIWAFHQFTLAGLLTNILAWPLVPFVMGWGALAAAWGSLPGSVFISTPAYGLARLVEWIGSIAYAVPWLEANNVKMSFPLLVATYLWIMALWWKLKRGKKLSTPGDESVSFSVHGM
jgi:ComEC/Rec2-related protein